MIIFANWRSRVLLAFISAMAFFAPPSQAVEIPFDQWLEGVRREALALGLKASTLDAALKDVKPIPRVIELDRKQPEFTMTFSQYQSRVVPASRVKRGKQRLKENRALLEKVSHKYGVQPRFIVAFWGIETDFGRMTGGYSLIKALATLAYDGRRGAYFRKELMNALRILDQGHIDVNNMLGSWAGAMGQSQFMPSSFLAYAEDFNGDGRKDIWKTKADVFASTANYLARSGWKGDQTWGRRVRLPKGFNIKHAGLKVKKRLSQWQKIGIRRANGSDLPKRDLSASLVLAEKSANGAAYLVYSNYRSILKWNRSTYFAVAVGTLADKIASR